ncbi:antitoxin Xre/MbcA/ParS toxin-binding domain-containing protein [Arhodomonas sp. SL1]|uniref:antitoxin Xre/MbcA/ParS toxin-binding domain-containing protein n=1 Tax=Arhodomonas sp. SL1 TaxID=3425691 RepID=UPI003F883E60
MPAHSEIQELGELLGLPDAAALSYLSLSEELVQGLSVASLDRIARQVAPDDRSFPEMIVPRGTLKRRRRENRPLSAYESEKLARTARIWRMALEVYKDEGQARRFLHQPHPLLEGRTPLELTVESGIGADAVEHILGRLKYGSAA